MNREQKQSVIAALKNDFESSEGSFVVAIQGLNVAAIQKVKKGLRADGAQLRIAKNTLLRLAVSNAEVLQDLASHFSGQIGMVFAPQNSVDVVKALAASAKEHEALGLLGGLLEGKVLSADDVKVLVALPAKQVLQAQILASINAPMVRLALLYMLLMMKVLWLITKAAEQAERGQN